MSKSYLEGNEIERFKMCVRNIDDKLQSLKSESSVNRPYKYYIKEKIDSIILDAKIIESLTHIDES